MISEGERQRYYSAMQQMKNSGEYDRLSEMHRQVLVLDIRGRDRMLGS
jgi:hypothetical protein